jgi:hypothetical protein
MYPTTSQIYCNDIISYAMNDNVIYIYISMKSPIRGIECIIFILYFLWVCGDIDAFYYSVVCLVALQLYFDHVIVFLKNIFCPVVISQYIYPSM